MMRYIFKRAGLRQELKGKHLFIFLDYDGTLTPIVKSPDEALIPVKTRELLKRLSRRPRCKVAIISGRALADVRAKVGLKNIIYVGNHGLEIYGPKIKFENPVSADIKALLQQIREELKKKLSPYKGVIIEDKGLSLSIHYRLARKKDLTQIKTAVHESVISYIARGRLRIKYGKKVFELRPPVEWDKGKIVLWLLARYKFSTKERAPLPIYIGDDKTDEDAFRVLRRGKGYTIFVGRPSRTSYAGYYVRNPVEVFKFLRLILALQ